MLQGRVCKAGCPGWIQRRVCKVLGSHLGRRKGLILTWRLEGEVVFYKGEQGAPGPERL